MSGDLDTRVKLTPGGTYLITGGQGGLGTTFAERLARLTQGHFVMTSRQVFPAEEQWERLVDDPDTSSELRTRIEALQLIRAAGGSVHLMQADSSDANRMREVVDWCREKLGGLHGIIHAAGVAPRGMILTKTREQAEQVLQPKILGSSWIEEALGNSNSRFRALVFVDQCDHARPRRCRLRHGQRLPGCPRYQMGQPTWNSSHFGGLGQVARCRYVNRFA